MNMNVNELLLAIPCSRSGNHTNQPAWHENKPFEPI